ncbi:hypothetical protein I547_0835 [Mycobacterium kansasii 824]|uniref:Uncharacterized protein n=1 Tax=Mycobacterium kansasii TaxID=1768 RepID=A0A1V3XUU7_MYCKA|nr:hypothetical protein I547_0835 [Mycobacterium kansasii 824]OOK82872.1 hypothetical protein BZL30_1349 [Mycobacterium kansasii]OOK83930.1 hypothetical protein BZL29_0600 [Mycobacterium kansasii]
MEYEAINSLRERHPAWRLLRAGNATLILSFLGGFSSRTTEAPAQRVRSRPPWTTTCTP